MAPAGQHLISRGPGLIAYSAWAGSDNGAYVRIGRPVATIVRIVRPRAGSPVRGGAGIAGRNANSRIRRSVIRLVAIGRESATWRTGCHRNESAGTPKNSANVEILALLRPRLPLRTSEIRDLGIPVLVARTAPVISLASIR
jgi:hypothetical protein